MKSRTTKHLGWIELQRLIGCMKEDRNRLHLLCTIQSMLGLRVSDVLSLRWRDLLFNAELSLIEKKTGKTRKLIVNPQLQEIANDEFKKKWGRRVDELVFLNKHNTGAISISYVNRELKKAFKKYEVEAEQVSSHVFRKTWAMKVLVDNDYSEKAMFLVSRMLNHTTIATTATYLMLDDMESEKIYNSLSI